MSQLPSYVYLHNATTSIILDCSHSAPALLYYGARLHDQDSAHMLALLATRQEAKCSPALEPVLTLTPSHAEGFTGAPGLEIHGMHDEWSSKFNLIAVKQSATKLELISQTKNATLQLTHYISLDEHTQVASFQTEITNLSLDSVAVQWLAAATIPVPDNMTKIKAFEGRWAGEFQLQEHDIFMGSYVRENRRGKTSHDCFPGFMTCHPYADEQQGQCLGFHLATSGNHRTRVEMMADGRTYAQAGELLFPGEVQLARQTSYCSPLLYIAYSHNGLSDLSHQFHQYIRANILQHSPDNSPRPIHYNTWEGIYFDHDPSTLMALADEVAALGVERFVLDDGWFNGRRSDKAGLGDWQVDQQVYPEGLGPLIEHVTGLGMAFGLWFEPEMVNPDSELYRAHPEWVLAVQDQAQVPFRHQYVLDLSNPEVSDYLFRCINDILCEYPQISYIKWDMNRDINHPGNITGKPAVHQYVKGVYSLIAQVKEAHPQIEIESCCSGGGRVDLGILQHTDRFWTSDSNDALDRLTIQRGFSFFFPAEIMGAHVGPRHCHITGRNLPIETRAAVAFFGHMGMEMDPRELSQHEKTVLSDAFALHKKHRQLIHSGNLFRQNADGMNVNFGVVANNKEQGLFAYNSVFETKRTTPGQYRFFGLDPQKRYRLQKIWPLILKEYSPSILEVIENQVFSGELLLNVGLQLPVLFPQTCLIFYVQEV